MDFYVYRLNYASKQGFEDAMKDRGVLVEVDGKLIYGSITLSIVRPIIIVDTPATYDVDGNELTPTVLSTRYHADIKVTEELDFSSSVAPVINTPVHGIKWAEGAKNL